MKLCSTAIGLAILCSTANAKLERVYIGQGKGPGIYFSDLDTGTGTLTTPQLALDIGRPGFLTIHPNKQFIYSIAYGGSLGRSGGVAAMKVQPDGTLELLNMQSSEGRGGCHVNLDQTGKCLMTAYYGSGSVASFQTLENGSLSEVVSYHAHTGSGEHPKRQQKAFAHSVFPNPGNTHAYVADLGIDKIMIYKLDADSGTLSPAGETIVPGGSMGPRHMKWNAEGTILYVLNELDLSVSAFKALEDGQLEFIKTVSTQPDGFDKSEMTCAEIRIHPNGKFIYASNRDLAGNNRDSITIFTCFEDGFERLESVPAEVWIPRNFNLDPSGKWMIVGGQRSQNIAIFKVDPKTGLLKFTGSKVPFEGGPICFEFL